MELVRRCTVPPTEDADWVFTVSHFNLLENYHFVARSGPVILIFNTGWHMDYSLEV
jgi:hypothetical protein